MQRNFPEALKLVLKHEGGYVNHPRDPGGATNKGVIQATYNSYRKANGQSTRSVRDITNEEVADIYKKRYWNAVRGDELPSGVDYAVFDFGVNSGPSRAIKFLQRVVNVDDDGVLGPMTMDAISRKSAASTIHTLCDRRLAWLKTLGHWGTFGKGWTNRVKGVKANALAMEQSNPTVEPIVDKPAPPVDEDTLEPVVTEMPKPENATSIGVGVVGIIAAIVAFILYNMIGD